MPKLTPSGRIVAALVALVPLVTAGRAGAFTFIGRCGSPVEKDSGPIDEMRNACSLPLGTPEASGYFRAIAKWNDASNMAVTARFMRDASDCRIKFGDWNNEIALVDRSQIDNNNGLTTYNHVNVCFLPGGDAGNYGETDVRVARDLNFGRPPENAFMSPDDSNLSTPGKLGGGIATMTHEIGHQLGLGHTGPAFNLMNVERWPLGGDDAHPPQFMGDEAAGAAQLYFPRGLLNLSASARRMSGSSVVDIFSTRTLCRSSSLPVSWTVANNGSVTQTFNQRLTLVSEFLVAFTLDVWRGGSVGFFNQFTWSASFPLASIPPGRYVLVHEVDHDGGVAEFDEADNVVVQQGIVEILNC